MPIRGPYNLNWPWQWLRGDPLPGEYQVPRSVQPTLDVSQEWPFRYQFVETTQNAAAGVTTVVAATAPLAGQQRVVEAWTMEADDWSTVDLINLFWQRDAGDQQMMVRAFQGTAPLFPNGLQIPLIGCETWIGTASSSNPGQRHPGRPPVYLAPGDSLRLSVQNGAAVAAVTSRLLIRDLEPGQPARSPFPFA